VHAHDAPLSRHAHDDAPLSADEQAHTAGRLQRALVTGGLLLVGVVHRRLFPDQADLSALVLAAGAALAIGPVAMAAIRGFVTRDPNAMVDQLVALALTAAVAAGDFETAILIPLLMEIGHVLEERGVLGAHAAIEGLKTLRPARAELLTERGEETVPVERLRPGDRILVRPGDAFPADGRVVHGVSIVDQSTMTGESVPEDVAPGATVFAGTLNVSGALEVQVTAVAETTALGRIVALLREAEGTRTPMVRVIERYGGTYLPAVVALAALVLVWSQDLSRAIAILVVSCPCALVLASPSAMTAALAVAARLGVLVKNARFIEVMGDVDTLILDKTGTVTTGRLDVVRVEPVDGATADDVLATAAGCARGSRHPVARAVADRSGVHPTEVMDAVEEVHGRGLLGRRDGLVIRMGSATWLRDEGLAVPQEPAHPGPMVWVARDRRVLGLVLLADRPRAGGREAIEAMRALGVGRVILATGDRPEAADAVGAALGVDEVMARVLPDAKLATVERERARGRRVMVVGDGVNDALALRRADIGVAMGAMGSDVAVSSADVALMGTDLGRLPQVMRLARQTRRIIDQNAGLAIGTSLAIMTLAGLGVITPVIGALVQNVGTVLVVLNSARILRFPGGLDLGADLTNVVHVP
jgi:Cd2+/Zn2+-exporting ATPase/Cu+-exporting ATPase